MDDKGSKYHFVSPLCIFVFPRLRLTIDGVDNLYLCPDDFV